MANTSKKRGANEAAAGKKKRHQPSRKAKTLEKNDVVQPPDEMFTMGDLIRVRASETELKDTPIIFYPSHGTNYVGNSVSDILTLSNKAASYYNTIVPERTTSDDLPKVVALLGPSNLDYLVGMLGLSRLGHTILLLSTRISEEAHVSLLKVTGATCLLTDDAYKTMGEKVQTSCSGLQLNRIAPREDYEIYEERPYSNILDPLREAKNVALILHSSGSTSLPKPNYQTHAAALANFKSQWKLTGFITLPLFHAQGLSSVFRSVMNRKPIYMYNASLPLTRQYLISTLREHPEIQILYGVPYAMKLLVDSDESLALCKKLEVLFCGGGSCPKPIGDKLAQNGVYLVSHYGTSETGQLMNSYRPHEELAEWDWLRPSDALKPYLYWEPYDTSRDIFECVILDGWPSKVATNRQDSGYATSDLWERHPDYPAKNAWRYYARRDDTIVLSNGEKANPLQFEDIARESPLVDDAIVFGSEKPHMGVFIVPSDPSSTLNDVIDDVWPAIQRGNKTAAAHAQISKEMIILLTPENAQRIRRTDKSGLIRSAFYKDFKPLIDSMYEDSTVKGTLALDSTTLKSFLRKEIELMVEFDRRSVIRDDTDLFSLGIDSLQASRLRSTILKHINIGPNSLSESFVFDHPSIENMASELLRLRLGEQIEKTSSVEDHMQSLIEKYGTGFDQHKSKSNRLGASVLVTGATGSLGVHIVAQLCKRPEVSNIYCLVRASSHDTARERVRRSLQERRLELCLERLHIYAADFADFHLGLSDTIYNKILEDLSGIIHCAWDVNFNLSLTSFESSCVKGTRYLIDTSLRSKSRKPADFIFCSSISTVGNNSSGKILEEEFASLSVAQKTGYAQSKLVAEHICSKATRETGLVAKILRIGQIVGDSQFGIWNPQEAIPLIIKSAKTIDALPALDDECSWLPVDVVATGVIELSSNSHGKEQRSSTPEIYHVVNSKTSNWTKDIMPLLREAGLEFDIVTPQDWLTRLKALPDPVSNPPYKLIDFFTAKYGNDKPKQHVTLSSEKARAASQALNSASKMDSNLITNFVAYITTA